jgi:hypothetical protein
MDNPKTITMFVRNALIGMALGAGVLAYEDRKFGEDV